jgi:GMP reductase
MSSDYAQEKHFGGKKDYRASEGSVEEVPYVGSVVPIIEDLLGGLRSTGTYIGASNIKDFGKCATLIKVNRIHDKF